MHTSSLLAVVLLTLSMALPARAGVVAQSHPPELVLAGGSLGLCTSLSLRHCDDGIRFIAGRTDPTYRVDAEHIEVALDPSLWPTRDEPFLAALAAQLRAVRDELGNQGVGERRLISVLEQRCTRCGTPAPWLRMDAHERASLLAAFELPQHDATGARLREHVAARASRDGGGVAVVQRFVDAARARAGGDRPRIAFVTASALDSFDAVDFYDGLFREFDADPLWWPVDAALAGIVFGERDCSRLEAARRSALGMPRRGELYPDLEQAQRQWCMRDDAAEFPADVHGVFFAGGDQWRLLRAFTDAAQAPNPWLIGMREAFRAGRVVVGGTSAGTAVQSGAGMLSNGTPQHALVHGAVFAPPPVPGCARDRRCGDIGEDAMTLSRAGGFGLAGSFLVDTHFSERTREWRLLRALPISGRRLGLGVDEASALHLRLSGEHVELDAVGARGGWVFAVDAVACNRVGGEAAYLAPGARVRIDGARMQLIDAARIDVDDFDVQRGEHPFAAGAVRAEAWRLARGEIDEAVIEADDAKLRLARGAGTQAWQRVGSVPGVVGLAVELQLPGADCAH